MRVWKRSAGQPEEHQGKPLHAALQDWRNALPSLLQEEDPSAGEIQQLDFRILAADPKQPHQDIRKDDAEMHEFPDSRGLGPAVKGNEAKRQSEIIYFYSLLANKMKAPPISAGLLLFMFDFFILTYIESALKSQHII